MTKPKQHEDDIIIQIIVIISILITTLLDAIQCLISLNSRSSTPVPTNCGTPSNATTPTLSGNMKTQRSSPSTKRRSTTAVQRKEVGGTKQDSQSLLTASSPKGRRSKPSSSTSTSTKSKSSQALGFQPRTQTTKSTSTVSTPHTIPQNVLTIADNNDRDQDSFTETQSA